MQERLDKKYSDEKCLYKKFKFSPPFGVKLDPNLINSFTFGHVIHPFELTSTTNKDRLHLGANYAKFSMFVHTGVIGRCKSYAN